MQVSLELAEAKLILTRARIRNVPTMMDTVRHTQAIWVNGISLHKQRQAITN